MKKLFAAIVLLSFVFGQEIGIAGSKSWTNNQDLENPLGFSLYLSQPLFQKLHVRVEFSRHTNQRKYIGITDEGGPVGNNSKTELIKSDAYINSIELSFICPIFETNYLNVNIGSGISTSSLDANKKGTETGRPIGVLGVNKVGLSLILQFETKQFTSFQIYPNFLFRYKYLSPAFSEATDIENSFNNPFMLSELQIGLSYSF